jgi:hypothetical protein
MRTPCEFPKRGRGGESAGVKPRRRFVHVPQGAISRMGAAAQGISPSCAGSQAVEKRAYVTFLLRGATHLGDHSPQTGKDALEPRRRKDA